MMNVTNKMRSLSRRTTLVDEVYEILHNQILDLELPPGTRLKDSELAASLGISNTPLREALRRLEEAELVETIPRRGTFVKELDQDEIEGLYEVREALEVLAVRRAAVRASDDLLQQVAKVAALHLDAVQRDATDEFLQHDRHFHDLIATGAGNPILASLLRGLADRIHIVRRMDLGRRQDELSGQEHHEIADALLRRDGEAAARLMESHIREHGDRVLDLYNEKNQEDRDEGAASASTTERSPD
jgi:DNA-binding GntR family transcriptional regulator